MSFTFKKLWKLLLDRNIKKKDLANQCGVSLATFTRMRNDEDVTIRTLDKICQILECNIEDIVEVNLDDGMETKNE